MAISINGTPVYAGRVSTSIVLSSSTGVIGNLIVFSQNGSPAASLGSYSGCSAPTLIYSPGAPSTDYWMSTVQSSSWSITLNAGGYYMAVSWVELAPGSAGTWAVGLTGTAGYTANANTLNVPSLLDASANTAFICGFDSQDSKGGTGTSNVSAAVNFTSTTSVNLYNTFGVVIGELNSGALPYYQFGSLHLNSSSLSNIIAAVTIDLLPPAFVPSTRRSFTPIARAASYFKRESGLWSPESGLIPKAA